MVSYCKHSCFVEVGLILDDEKIILDDKLDNLMYSKILTLLKKLVRKKQKINYKIF